MSPVSGTQTEPSVIALLRTHIGWTQVQLAYWFGVSELTLSRWENGYQTPPELHARVARLILNAKNPATLIKQLGPEAWRA